MNVKEIRIIETKKGYELSAIFYRPKAEVKAAVLIVSAIGVSQDYYSDFACWLASKGYLVASFDYMGVGESLSGRLKDVDVTVLDWVRDDCMAMVEALSSEAPGKRLNMVGDLPRGVINQWRKWCLHPEYMVGVEGESVRTLFASVTMPITSLSFTDDELMSEKSISSLHGFYSTAAVDMIRISPNMIGEQRIGHFGFFKQSFQKTLWEPYLLTELKK